MQTAEHRRLRESRERTAHWKRWGPYLAERAWGTVREDYSPGGTAWDDLPHDHARSRAYRWNEDGLGGLCDDQQHLCFAMPWGELASWEAHLAADGIAIESRITWPRGGTSLYLRDPDGHSLEIATPGLWPSW